MAEEYARRRRLLAVALVGCAIAACSCASRLLPSPHWGGLLWDGYGSQETNGEIKRARTHQVPTTADGTVAENGRAVGAASPTVFGGSRVGITARDAHGLLVEIASPIPVSHDATSASDTERAEWIPPTTKIINGLTYSRSSHPYIARIHWTYPGENADDSPFRTAYCGGSLIAPNIVLTAAHCLGNHEKYVDVYDVKLGRPITYRIEKAVVHPLYDETVFGHDFGLVVLEGNHMEVATKQTKKANNGEKYWSLKDSDEYDWASAPPIIRLHRYSEEENAATKNVGCGALSQRQSEEATTLTVIGYGATKFGPEGASDPSYAVLQGADVHYLLNEDCNEQYMKAGGVLPPRANGGKIITEDMLCAWDNAEGQDACSGDSGGPLTTHVTAESGSGNEFVTLVSQVGITSWGIGCGSSKFPGVYSRVANQIDWIEGEICGRNILRSRGKKGDGLSPLSCVSNEKGERHMRDYAMEAVLRKKRSDVARREAKEVSGVRRVQVEATNRAKNGGQKERKLLRQSRMESCELLEGRAVVDTPTNRPTKRPKKADDGIGDIDLSTTCPVDNRRDVKSFFVGMAHNPRQKNCRWVRRRCRKRCDEYAVCCPETCAQEKCRG